MFGVHALNNAPIAAWFPCERGWNHCGIGSLEKFGGHFLMNIQLDKTIPIAVFIAGLQACSASDTPLYASTMNAHSAGVAGAAGTSTHAAGSVAAGDAAPSKPSTAIGRKAYVGLFGDGAVGVVDVDNRAVVTTIPVSAPDGLIITPDGKKVFVSSGDTASVKVIDTATDAIAASIDVGSKPAGLTVTPDGRFVVASVGGADEAVIIDAKTNAVVRHVPVGQAHSSCVTTDSHYAYVGSQVAASPAIVKVDLNSDTPAQSFAVDKSPRALACEADHIYFTVVGLDAVELLDPNTGALGAPIASGGSPHDVRAAQPGQTELVVSQTAGDLEFIDVASATVVAHVLTGKLAHWIAVNADRSLAYVTNETDGNISVVDLEKRVVTDTIEVGKAPRKLALQP
jgi:YVTN family beta-propeller protein